MMTGDLGWLCRHRGEEWRYWVRRDQVGHLINRIQNVIRKEQDSRRRLRRSETKYSEVVKRKCGELVEEIRRDQ